MHRFLRRALLLIVAMSASQIWAQADDIDVLTEGKTTAPQIQPAPGGGDMVVLGPEWRYVTQAWRDYDGKMHCGCTREDPEAAETESVEEQ